MVVGIFPDTKAVKPIVDELKSSGADIDRLRVLTYDEIPTELASEGVEFVWLGDVERGLEVGDIPTGTETPGITGSHTGPGEIHGDELLEGLSELGIPDGRTDDYARAVAQGRLIMGYPAGDPASLRQLFTANGATSIEFF